MVKILLSLLVALAGAFTPLSAVADEAADADTITGFSTNVAVSESRGLPTGEPFTFVLLSPGGKEKLVVPGRLHASTEFIDVPGDKLTQAGRYSYRVHNKRNAIVVSGSFEAFTGPVAQTSVEVVEERGREKILAVRIADEYGNPVAGMELMLIAHDGSEAQPLDSATGEGGIARFLVMTDQAVAGYTVVDVASNFTKAVEVVFGDLPPDRRTSNSLRASLLDEFGRKEDEEDGSQRYGYVDHFEVRLRQNQVETKVVKVNEQLDIVIEALDDQDHIVKDYVGDVLLKTTDEGALTPLQSPRFLPSDKGVLERNLAFMFSEPGPQTVCVSDKDAPEIEGCSDFKVLSSGRDIARGSITIESPKDGVVGTGPVAIRGTTDAYINLKATDNDGEAVWTGESDAEGKFSLSLTFADPAAPTHEIVVSEGDGGLGRVSKPLILTVDTSAPQLRSDTLALLPETVAPGGAVTVSIVAEAKHSVAASLAAGASEVPLTERQTVVEEGWSTYEATLTAGAQAGSYPVTVLIRDAAGNTSRATKTLVVTEAGLPTVQGVQAQILANGIQLVWLPVAGASSYRIYFGLSPNDLSNHIDTASTATSVRLTGLHPGQTYYVAITALSVAGGESAEKSQLVSIQPQGSLFETRIFPLINGARVEWVKPAQADIVAYRLQYGVQPGKMYTEQRLIDPQSTRFEMPDLINGVPYYVSLSALLRDGKLLEDTAEVSVTPGEGGKPGIHLAPSDPLPADLGQRFSPAELDGEEDAVVSGSEQHRSAPSLKRPPRTPRSGFPVLSWAGILSLAAGSSLALFLQSRRKERRLLLTIQRHYAACDS